ncbi:hypothetical protein NESM_000545500 [Novymonas esmeraldas]|uniref:Uncharacterized protein n=1 Tax=Novymonas esmeraldas TaxID=1808958 RepID=A0AAW0ESI3_9TRYP
MMGRLHNAEQRAEELRRTLEDRERTYQNKVLEERARSRQDLEGIKNQFTSMAAQLESKKLRHGSVTLSNKMKSDRLN